MGDIVMYKIKKLTLLLFFSLCIFSFINSTTAADYYVNNDTSHKDIANWMKNNAKSGDKLIFNTSSYELNKTIIISKPISIVSYKNTTINFRKQGHMFNVRSNSSFRCLNLNHHDVSYPSNYVIYSNSRSYIKVNLNNVNINILSGSAIEMNRWVGKVNKCNIYSNGSGIFVNYGKVDITNSEITTESHSVFISIWSGSLVNSTIVSKKDGFALYSDNWKGNIIRIIGSKMYSNKDSLGFGAVSLGSSKGTIKNSVIRSNSKYALKMTDNVKIIKSSISSKNNLKKIHMFKPDLAVDIYPIEDYLYLPKKSYEVSIHNLGYKSSKECYLSFKTMKISKKYYVKPLKPGTKTTIKINFNPKYMTKEMNIKYPKVFKVDCYNKIKEERKDNNIFIIDKRRYIRA